MLYEIVRCKKMFKRILVWVVVESDVEVYLFFEGSSFINIEAAGTHLPCPVAELELRHQRDAAPGFVNTNCAVLNLGKSSWRILAYFTWASWKKCQS